MNNRVVITGMGAVTPIGIGIDKFWHSLNNGESGISHIGKFDTKDFPTKIAAEVNDFNPEDFLSRKEMRRMDKFSQFAIASAKMAVEDSKIDINNLKTDKVGVIVGSGIGGIETLEEQHKILLKKGPKRISPLFIPMLISNMAGGHISIEFNAKGVNYTVVSACASATNAIGEGFRLIKNGKADVIIVGGTEAPITPLAVSGFASMKAMSTKNEFPEKASKPFDLNRDGFVIGEGSGFVVLENYEHAIKRNGKIYSEVTGYGTTADSYHLTQPDPSGYGALEAMKLALKEGDVSIEQVDYINAHGTSTPLNDKSETIAIKKLFKEHAYNLSVSSIKSMTGHLLGAAGAIEVISTSLTIKDSIIPPTINYETPDPECDLNYVPNKAINKNVKYALSNSFGFGGHNTSLLLADVSE